MENQTLTSTKWLLVIGSLWLVLAIALLIYQLVTPPKVKISWDTATELETAGFNLHRSTSPTGEFTLVNRDRLIPSEGSATSGASYTYVDTEVKAGETYYYLLEEIELDASSNRYEEDIFTYAVPRVTWWAVVLTAVSLLIGIALLIAGFREMKT